jgi:hypothetical protein
MKLQNIKEGKNTKRRRKEIKHTNKIFQFKRRIIDTAQFHRQLHWQIRKRVKKTKWKTMEKEKK